VAPRNKVNMATRSVDAAASPEDKDGSDATNSSRPQSKKLNGDVKVQGLSPGFFPRLKEIVRGSMKILYFLS
jgi:hypothetical protein